MPKGSLKPSGIRLGETAVAVGIERLPNGVTQMHFNASAVTSAEHTLPIHCGDIILRFGSLIELHLLQLDPYDDKKAVRGLVVQIQPEPFVQRWTQLTEFRRGVQATVKDGIWQPGQFTRLFREADKTSVTSAIIDSSAQALFQSGQHASILIFTASTAEIATAVQAGRPSVTFVAEVEATLHVAALADLLDRWEEVVGSLP